MIRLTTWVLALVLAACSPGSDDRAGPAPAAGTGQPESPAAPESRPASIVGETVSYSVDGVTMNGYIAYDTSRAGRRPGVLIVHEWWGHNDYVRERARMLAEMGYTALAVDMYGDGKVAEHPADAQKFMGEVISNMDSATRRFEAARTLLEAHASSDPTRTAAIGYCFGGAVVLQMARAGLDLDGVASFHGSLGTQTPAAPGKVKARVLVAHGDADPFVPAADVVAFQKEMADAGVDMTFLAYPGALHGFTSPGATALGERFDLPLRYDADADRESWAALDRFLTDLFRE